MRSKRRMWIIGLGIVLLLVSCDRGQIFHRLRPQSVILAFGDSLTSGSGTERESSYPAQLEELIARKVVNAGVTGETSAEGAERLPGVLAEQEPDLVILGYGGEDPRRETDRQQLQNNLRRMFEAVNQRGTPMVMIAVAPPGGAAGDADLYEELSKELNIPLVRPALEDLPPGRQAGKDQLQLNAAGCRKLADAVVDKLFELRAI